MSPKEIAYIIERLAVRFMAMMADYERRLAEHRASFGARTSADAKIIEGLRKEIGVARMAVLERDGLLTQVQDQRAEIERLGEKIDELPMQTTVMAVARREGEERAAEVLQSRVQDMREEIIRVNEAHGKTKVERDGLLDELAAQREAFTAEVGRIRRELCEERNALRAEVALHQKEHAGDQQAIVGLLSERDKLRAEVTALKHEVDTLSCPYVSGQRVRVKSEGGLITQQSEYGIGKIGIINAFAFVARIGSRGWVDLQDIEPCDPPEASHDTPAGKEAAEAVIRDSRSGEVMLGDVVEVVSDKSWATFRADIGRRGKVIAVADTALYLKAVPGYAVPAGGVVGKCDVRKVPQ